MAITLLGAGPSNIVGGIPPDFNGSRELYNSDKLYFTTPDNAAFSTGDIDFTWAGWIKIDQVSDQYFVFKQAAGSLEREYCIYYDNAAGKWNFLVSSNGTTWGGVLQYTAAIVVGTWYFIVFEHNSVADTLSAWVNNVAATPVAYAAGVRDGTAGLYIGTNGGVATGFINGKISKIGFWKRTLTSTQKTWLYNAGAGRFYSEMNQVIDTSNMTTNLQAYYDCNGLDATQGLIDKHSTNTLTLTTGELLLNTGFETVTQRYGARQFNVASSRYFDGTDNANLEIGANDAWVCSWVYLDSKAALRAIVGKFDINGNKREYLLRYDNTADRFIFSCSTDGTATNNVDLSANTFGSPSISTWYFIIAYHDSATGQLGISVNGGNFDTVAYSGGVLQGTAKFAIGCRYNSTPTSYMDGRLNKLAFGKSPVGGISALKTTIRDALYNSGKGMHYEGLSSSQKTTWGLVEYWNANETTVSNLTGQHAAINLTNINSVAVAAGVGPSVIFQSWTNTKNGNSNVIEETTLFDSGSRACRLQCEGGAVVGITETGLIIVGHRYKWQVRARNSGSGSINIKSGRNAATNVPLTNVYTTYTQTEVASDNTVFAIEGEYTNINILNYVDNVSLMALDSPSAAGPS